MHRSAWKQMFEPDVYWSDDTKCLKRHRSYYFSFKHKSKMVLLTICIIKFINISHTLHTFYYFTLQTYNTGTNKSHSNFQIYIIPNCMPVLWVCNWKYKKSVLCTKKLCCSDIPGIITSNIPMKALNIFTIFGFRSLISAFMKWSRCIIVHSRPMATKCKCYLNVWNPFPLYDLYEFFWCLYTEMNLFTKCTLIFQFIKNINFKKPFCAFNR